MTDYNVTVQINALVQRRTFLRCSLLSCAMWFLVLSLRMKSYSVTIQMKTTEQHGSCGTVCYAVQGGSNFRMCG